MDISRASHSPLRPTHDSRTHHQGHARRQERLAREASGPEQTRPERARPERQRIEPTEPAQPEREQREVERSDRRANGLLEGFRAARRGLRPTTPGQTGNAGPANGPGGGAPGAQGTTAADGLAIDQPSESQPPNGQPLNGVATQGPNERVNALAERFLAARDGIQTRLENALQGVQNPDDIAFLEERAALAEERLFTRFTNALGGLFMPNEPAATNEPTEPAATEPVARVVNIGPGSDNVSATLVSSAGPTETSDTTPAAPVNPEEELVGRLVAANEAIDRRLANALEGVQNPDDIAFLRDRAETARERVTTRFLNALGRERGVAPNAAGPTNALGADADRMLVDRFLEASASFDQRATNALANATEPGARADIQERLNAAQDRIVDRLLAALGNAQVAPADPPVAVDPQQGPRSLRLDAGQFTATTVGAPTNSPPVEPPTSSNEIAQAAPSLDANPSGDEVEGTEPDPRRLFAERVRAAFEGLRARATQAFEGTETRREQLGLAQRLAEARDALVARIQPGSGPDEV